MVPITWPLRMARSPNLIMEVRWDGLTVRCFTCVQTAVLIPAYYYNGLMIDSQPEDKDVIGFQLGYENAPGRYSWQKEGVPASDEYLFGWLEGLNGRTIKTNIIYAAVDAPTITAYGRLLEKYYTKIHQSPQPRSSREETLKKISNAIIN